MGHNVPAESSEMDPADTILVRALKVRKPNTGGELSGIMGLLSYYRQYIQDFAHIAGPLYNLLKASSDEQQTATRGSNTKTVKGKCNQFNT